MITIMISLQKIIIPSEDHPKG